MNSLGHATVDGNGKLQVGNNYTYNYNEPNRSQCLADLRLTDPRDDKIRIEQTKGGLLKDSYRWILDHEDFRQWRNCKESRLLWIKGDAGKGKTMLLCGIIDELSMPHASETNKRDLLGYVTKAMSPMLPTYIRPVSFFFCQGTDSRLNKAVAVLRGLMYVLLCQQPSLISYIQSEYDHAGRQLFEDTNVFYTMSRTLLSMLGDRHAKGCYMIIDALDECEQGLPQLLDFIVQVASATNYVKWIVSSRNRPDIEQLLHRAASKTRLSLELNSHHVAQAVNAYVDHKVVHLVSLNGNKSLQDQVRDEMRRKADGTFLWVALVAQELEKVQSWDVLSVLKQMPSGLTPLYHRMMNYIEQLRSKNREFCRLVISTATVAYRPLHLCELGVLSGLPGNVSDDLQSVIDMCASFLTIQDDHVYLIHQSAKDFLTSKESKAIFQHEFTTTHHNIFLKSMQIMFVTLRRDRYDLHHPGISIDDVRQPEPDPLAAARYSCIYWIDHLSDAISHRTSRPINGLKDDGTVHQFLSKKYLYWLEALSLLRRMPEGVIAMMKLERLLEGSDKSRLFDLVRDGRRFIQSHGCAIGKAPLQAYASALIFSPMRSITRNLFEGEEPSWIVSKPAMAEDWDACMATLEGHCDWVSSVTFSPNGQHLASASYDRIVKIWDATTGHCQATLFGHSRCVYSVAFSPDSQRLASASDDTVKIWDAMTGHCQATLESGSIESVTFSPDGQLLAWASYDNKAWIWDVMTYHDVVTLEGHCDWVNSVAFSPNGQRLASASHDKTVKIWDAMTGHCQLTLEGHSNKVNSMAFSPDGQRLASASDDMTVKIWDAMTGHCQATLEGHGDTVNPVAFSPDGQRLASVSYCNTVKIWDATTGHCQAIPRGHGDTVNSVAFSPNGQRLASASDDMTVKIWDATTGHCQAIPRGHGGTVESVAFSPDGQRLASGSWDKTVKIWDATTGHCHATLAGHSDIVNSVAFSPDSQRLVSASYDKMVKIWNATTGHCQATLKGHCDIVKSVAFSRDGQRLVSASYNKMVKIWDATTGHCQATLGGHSNKVNSMAFSPDGQRLASASDDMTVKIWDAMTGHCQSTLEGHSNKVNSMAFSPDGQRLASASDDMTVKIWDATTGYCQVTLEGSSVYSVAFSPDGQRLASASHDKMVKIWDATTGHCQVTLEGSSVYSVAFSPDGQRLASASHDKMVKIWDAMTGYCQATLEGHNCQVTLNVHRNLRDIRFDETGACLHTDAGTFDLSLLSPSSLLSPPAVLPTSSPPYYPLQCQCYGISADRAWITYQDRNLLWLPSEYRPGKSTIAASTVALGCNSGRVLLFRFSGATIR